MSELTLCNHCTLSAIERKGTRVKLKKDPLVGDDGQVVWPNGVRVIDRETNETIVWFAELPDRCVC